MVGGFSNIAVVLTGTLGCTGEFSFEYTMGANGGLPGGSPITYGVTGDMESSSSAAAAALEGCAVVTGPR